MSEQRIAGKGKYGWTAAFQVEYVGNECILTVKVRLKPKPDVTQAEIDTVKADTEAAFQRYWDEKFYLDDTKTSERFFLRAKLEWVTTGQHVTVKLVKGQGRANQTTWYSDGRPESGRTSCRTRSACSTSTSTRRRSTARPRRPRASSRTTR